MFMLYLIAVKDVPASVAPGNAPSPPQQRGESRNAAGSPGQNAPARGQDIDFSGVACHATLRLSGREWLVWLPVCNLDECCQKGK
jgi:hypothetical protein